MLGAAEAGDAPAALMPSEVEAYSSAAAVAAQQLDLAERDMLQARAAAGGGLPALPPSLSQGVGLGCVLSSHTCTHALAR